MNRKIAHILISAMSLMTLVGVVLSIVYYDQMKTTVLEDGSMDVVIKDNTSVEKEFDLAGINPGEQQEFLLRLSPKKRGAYEIELGFREIENHGLKELVNVRVLMNEEAVFEGTMTELLGNEQTIRFECASAEESTTNLRVIYSMSEEIGNEAMGTSLDFRMLLTARLK